MPRSWFLASEAVEASNIDFMQDARKCALGTHSRIK